MLPLCYPRCPWFNFLGQKNDEQPYQFNATIRRNPNLIFSKINRSRSSSPKPYRSSMGAEPEYGSDIFEPRNRSSFGSQLTRSTGSHDRFDDSEINSYPPTYPGSADSINSQEPTLENELLYSNPMKTPDGKSNSI